MRRFWTKRRDDRRIAVNAVPVTDTMELAQQNRINSNENSVMILSAGEMTGTRKSATILIRKQNRVVVQRLVLNTVSGSRTGR
jgi:hypothetical protein